MNHLAQSTSPYLLQHADNPVDWHPWGEQAIALARQQDKPIFLSIGYAACHWCHVMAHESFEDLNIAAFMNAHFINIKVDREERPDIDGIYMQAVVAMTGSGGWPTSVFLDHDLKPFYAGTYFPPVKRYNMPSFMDVLTGIKRAWQEDRNEIRRVGGQVQSHLMQPIPIADNSLLSKTQLAAVSKKIHAAYDWGYGGWGDAPKFPQPMVLEFLLHHMFNTHDQDSIKLISHCLHAMARGGMYDVVGGGFARYSTDQFWRVPHFEKMLYDNALLARAYLHAWQGTGDPLFRQVVHETLDFVIREMTNDQGGFYSSLDADSEGEEGRYYVWTQGEIRGILQEEAEFFEIAYGIQAGGNWEGKTVLQRALDDQTLAARFNMDPETITGKLREAHTRLLSARGARVRPGADDKVLTAWNGLMLAVFSEAGRVFDNQKYIDVATRNAEFLLNSLRPDRTLRRAWRNEATSQHVFLEDYAALSLGLLELYQTDFRNQWFATAIELIEEMIDTFSNPEGGFFDTAADGGPLPFRPRDVQDNATPSGNALACEALLKLHDFTGHGRYRDLAEKSLSMVVDLTLKYPLGFSRWLASFELAANPTVQIAILGNDSDERFKSLLDTLRPSYLPQVVTAASPCPPPDSAPPVLKSRPLLNGLPTAYVCEGFVCQQPTNDPREFRTQIESGKTH